MSTQGSVTRLVTQLQSNDTDVRNEAARLIWQRYIRALLALARDNLRPRIRRRDDEEDVLQDMYASFFRRQRRGEFDLTNRDELWGLLVRITKGKVCNAANKHRRRRRDVGRERSGPADDEPGGPGPEVNGIEDRMPTPAEAALLNESLEQRLAALGDPELRSVALKKLEGWTNAEIAASMGRTERSVERRLRQIRECWRDEELAPIERADGSRGEGCGP